MLTMAESLWRAHSGSERRFISTCPFGLRSPPPRKQEYRQRSVGVTNELYVGTTRRALRANGS